MLHPAGAAAERGKVTPAVRWLDRSACHIAKRSPERTDDAQVVWASDGCHTCHAVPDLAALSLALLRRLHGGRCCLPPAAAEALQRQHEAFQQCTLERHCRRRALRKKRDLAASTARCTGMASPSISKTRSAYRSTRRSSSGAAACDSGR